MQMPIEPHAVRYRVGTAVMPHERKSGDDYKATIIAKLGRLPSYEELAKLERAARQKLDNRYASIPSKTASSKAIGNRQHHNKTLGDWHDKLTLAAIPPGGATTKQIAAMTDRSYEGTRVSLRRLRDKGFVTSDAGNGHEALIWKRAA